MSGKTVYTYIPTCVFKSNTGRSKKCSCSDIDCLIYQFVYTVTMLFQIHVNTMERYINMENTQTIVDYG